MKRLIAFACAMLLAAGPVFAQSTLVPGPVPYVNVPMSSVQDAANQAISNVNGYLSGPFGPQKSIGVNNTVALIGTSREQQNQYFGNSSWGYVNWLNYLSGQAYNIVYNGGVSGDTTRQFLAAGLQPALASKARYVFIGGAINDSGSLTGDQVFDCTVSGAPACPGIKQAAQQLIANGQIPVFMGEQGQDTNISQVAMWQRFNQLEREFAQTGGAIFIDVPSVLWNTSLSTSYTASFTATATTTTLNVTAITSGTIAVGAGVVGTGFPVGTYISALGTGTGGVGTYTLSQSSTAASEGVTTVPMIHFKANTTQDGTHNDQLGGWLQGTLIYNSLKYQAGTPLLNQLTNGPIDNLFQNGTFLITSGGTISGAGTLASGTVPLGWSLTIPANVSVVSTFTADPSGYGNDWTLAYTNSAGAVNNTINISEQALIGSPVVGTQYTCGVNIAVSNISNFVGAANGCFVYYTSGNTSQLDFVNPPTVALFPPTSNYSIVSLPAPTTALPAGFGTVTNLFNVIYPNFTANGTGTITLSRAWMRQQ